MILGSDFDDVLIGDGGDDTIDGKGRHDNIWGDGGNDAITGGAGFDWIYGGPGQDLIGGGSDDDVIWSGDPSLLIGLADQTYDGQGPANGPDMFGTGEGGNNTVDGHEEPLGGGGYQGPSGGQGGSATGLSNIFDGPGSAPLNVPAPGALGNSSGKKAQLFQAPAYGDLTLNDNGSFTYTPNAGFYGIDVFLFVAVDIATLEESAPIPILLQIAGEAGSSGGEEPVAYEDFVSEPAGGGVSTGALEAFDSADAVQVYGAMPAHGSFSLNSDGTYTYTPASGFVGTDSFQYVAINTATNEQSEPATVTIVVYSTEPVAYSDSYSVNTSAVLNVGGIGVLANDRWGQAAFVVSGQGPSHGTLTLNFNGSFTYTPTAGFQGTDTFRYQAANSAAHLSAPATVTIQVSNTVPITADDEYTIPWYSWSIQAPGVLQNDQNAVSAQYVSGSGPAYSSYYGGFQFYANGSFHYDPAYLAGSDVTFQYVALNAAGLASQPATVTIHRQTPFVAADDVWPLSFATINVSSNDAPAMWSSIQITTAPAHGTLSMSNGYRAYTPEAGFVGTDSFQYTATEYSTGNTYGPVTVTLHVGTPVGASDEFTLGTNSSIGNDVLANDQWANAIQLVGSPAHGSLSLWMQNGVYSGGFNYTPDADFAGDDTFQYSAVNTLTGLQSGPVTVTFHVMGLVAHHDDVVTQVNSTVEANVLLNDEWANSAELVDGFFWPHGELTLEENGWLHFVPDENFEGEVTVQYIAKNGGLASAPATITIYVGYDPLTLSRSPVVSNQPILVMSQLLAISDEAVRRWAAAGVSQATIEAGLSGVQFVIADLPGSHIGGTTADGKVLIDINAAGYGWFVDTTAGDDAEFQTQISASERRATSTSAAFGRADLLSVVMHELGHVLGLDHSLDQQNVMAESIDLGVRHLPTAADASLVDQFFATRGRRHQ